MSVLAMAVAMTALAVFNDRMVVTATRNARPLDESLASVTVLTREDIEARQPQDISDLLRGVAGVDQTRSGGPGGDIAFFLRGTNLNHVLVLVDGVRVASPTTGAFEWRSVPLGQVERIEIVRGPRASLYGSDAIGGVIQIFTRRPQGAEFTLGAGTYGTRGAELAVGGVAGTTRMYATATHYASDGFSATNERIGFGHDPDNDGTRQHALSVGIERTWDETRVEFLARRFAGTAEFDQGLSEIDTSVLNARLAARLGDDWTHSLNLGHARDDLETRDAFASLIETRRATLDWQHDLALAPDQALSVALGYVRERGSNITLADRAAAFDRSESHTSALALWQRRFPATELQVAARYDDYSTFGGHHTYSVAWGGPTVSVSYGTAFRAPSFNELYHPGSGGLFAGNPELTPERSRTLELGLRRTLGARHHTELSLYATRVNDLIDFAGTDFQTVNLSRARIDGAELQHRFVGHHWHTTTTVTVQRARDAQTGAALVRRAARKLSLLAERVFARGAVGLEFNTASARRDAVGSVAGYGVVSLIARCELGADLSLGARLENVLDRDYQVIDGFNTPGRSAFISLHWRPL